MLTLSLRQCLEHLVALEAHHTLTDNQGITWTPAELLTALAQEQPERLHLRVHLRLPDAQHDGAIYQITQGGFIRRYHIYPFLPERLPPSQSLPEQRSGQA